MIDEIVVMGLMSGTSLDGIDLAACVFEQKNEAWTYKLLFAKTVVYSEKWKKKLTNAHLLHSIDLQLLNIEYGKYLASVVNSACQEYKLRPGLIASHGHTVFHAPDQGYTLQIGSGAEIAAGTHLPVVYDFRSLDIAKGGQGAPLVPVGDRLLFGKYKACLNLGGFSNISFERENQRIAFDICPVNIILNYLANLQGLSFDDNGSMGKKGEVDNGLLKKLDSLSYYNDPPPKSLSREWFEKQFLPLISNSPIPIEDKFTTVYHHISRQICHVFRKYHLSSVLVSGGGAMNNYLIDLLCTEEKTNVVIPDRSVIDFKEAIIFAFLGLLRYRGEVNCYASVTGANEDSVSGAVME